MAMALVKLAGGPVSPERFRPQPTTVPSVLRARLWKDPAEIATTSLSPGGTYHALALKTDGRVLAWGNSFETNCPNRVQNHHTLMPAHSRMAQKTRREWLLRSRYL